MAAPPSVVVSKQSGPGGAAGDFSEHPSISGNGQRVAFESSSDTLSPDDVFAPPFQSLIPAIEGPPTQRPDLFIHDVATDRTELISVDFNPITVPPPAPAQGVADTGTSSPTPRRAISGGVDLDRLGNHVAFNSDANNWDPHPRNIQDVWQRTFTPSLQIISPSDFGSVTIGQSAGITQPVVLRNVGFGGVELAASAFT